MLYNPFSSSLPGIQLSDNTLTLHPPVALRIEDICGEIQFVGQRPHDEFPVAYRLVLANYNRNRYSVFHVRLSSIKCERWQENERRAS